jgi:hypothetical protein
MTQNKDRKAKIRARMASTGEPYTEAARRVDAPEDDPFGGHEFEYESTTDLFRCTECRTYEVVARNADDGTISPCPGLEGWGGDPRRVYLLLTENPEAPGGQGEPYRPYLSVLARGTGLGRAPRYSSRGGRQLIETASSVAAELARQIEAMTFDVAGREVPAVSSAVQLTGEAGRAVIAENRAAYIAEYGEP